MKEKENSKFRPGKRTVADHTGQKVTADFVSAGLKTEEESQLVWLSLDRSADAIYWTGPDAKFLYVNEAACKALGYTREELLSMSAFDIDAVITEEDWRRLWHQLTQVGSDSIESLHRRKDGSIFPVDVTGTLLRLGNKEFNCAIVRDISERKRSEKIQASIYKISEAAQSADCLNELFRSIHEIITELMPAKDNFYIALYDEQTGLLSFPYFRDEYDETPKPKKLGKGLTEYVLRSGEPLLASPEVFTELVEKGEVVSIGSPSIDWLGVPLKTGGRTIGVLVVQTYTEGSRYSDEEKNVLMFVSEQVAQAILRAQAEEALRESEEQFRSVVEHSHNGIGIIDNNFRHVYVNDKMGELSGFSREEFQSRDFRQFLDEKNRKLVADYYRRRQQGEEIPSIYEFDFTRKDGETRRLETSSSVITDSKQGVKTIVQIRDVTEERKNQKMIESSLKEKEVLLREIHHRVKNNLQIISSLLNLQSRHIQDEKALEMFRESRLRVRSMAMVHEKLYRSEDLSRVDFGEYIKSLGEHLFQIFGVKPRMIELKVDVRDVFLDINTAIPCGLLVSELISNALKHAFPDDRKGLVHVSMTRMPGDRIKLEVKDSGIGIQQDLDLKQSASFGMQLVDMLVEQLQGEIDIGKKGGTQFTIVFQELKFSREI